MPDLPIENEPELCPVCGSPMTIQDGETVCPKCSAEIDWALDDADDDESKDRP